MSCYVYFSLLISSKKKSNEIIVRKMSSKVIFPVSSCVTDDHFRQLRIRRNKNKGVSLAKTMQNRRKQMRIRNKKLINTNKAHQEMRLAEIEKNSKLSIFSERIPMILRDHEDFPKTQLRTSTNYDMSVKVFFDCKGFESEKSHTRILVTDRWNREGKFRLQLWDPWKRHNDLLVLPKQNRNIGSKNWIELSNEMLAMYFPSEEFFMKVFIDFE